MLCKSNSKHLFPQKVKDSVLFSGPASLSSNYLISVVYLAATRVSLPILFFSKTYFMFVDIFRKNFNIFLKTVTKFNNKITKNYSLFTF